MGSQAGAWEPAKAKAFRQSAILASPPGFLKNLLAQRGRYVGMAHAWTSWVAARILALRTKCSIY